MKESLHWGQIRDYRNGIGIADSELHFAICKCLEDLKERFEKLEEKVATLVEGATT